MNKTHRRYNPLTDEWILVSPNRTQRPWQGQTEDSTKVSKPRYDPNCYLCPNNIRANGEKNPDYNSTFIFINDYSSLNMNNDDEEIEVNNLIKARAEKGICKVICFSPRHDFNFN